MRQNRPHKQAELDEGKHVDSGDAIDLLYEWIAVASEMGDDGTFDDLVEQTKSLLGVD